MCEAAVGPVPWESERLSGVFLHRHCVVVLLMLFWLLLFCVAFCSEEPGVKK